MGEKKCGPEGKEGFDIRGVGRGRGPPGGRRERLCESGSAQSETLVPDASSGKGRFAETETLGLARKSWFKKKKNSIKTLSIPSFPEVLSHLKIS